MGSCCSSAAGHSPSSSSSEVLVHQHNNTSSNNNNASNKLPSYDRSGKGLRTPETDVGDSAGIGFVDLGSPVGAFYQRLTQGADVMVIPVARTAIVCQLYYDPVARRLVLKKDHLTRAVALNTVERVMHEKRDLLRVEGAQMGEDPLCCALLLKSHTCIGLRWSTPKDKADFVTLIHQLIHSTKKEATGISYFPATL